MDFENDADLNTGAGIEEHSKFDSLWLGLTVGIVVPAIAFLMFYYSSFTKVSFNYFIHYSIQIGALINILTVSLIPDFLIFSLFIWRKHYASAKGVLIASASFTGFLIIGKIIIEMYLR